MRNMYAVEGMLGLCFILFLVSSLTYPEISMTVPELIQYYKYPVEIHDVTTKDGYILTHHRIPIGRDTRPAPFAKENQRPVVVFVHGTFGDSSNFVLNPPPYSPGYIFADAGFDAWLLNCRGSKYSLKHENLTIDDKAFWNFSWYEIATRDLTDSVDYILEVTGEIGLYYVGHSQGTRVAFVRLSEDPDGEFGKKIRQLHAMGPSGGKHGNAIISSFFRLLEIVYSVIGDQLQLTSKFQEFLADIFLSPIFSKSFAQLFTTFPPFPERKGQFNHSRTAFYLDHFPGSTSLLDLVYYFQVYNSNVLRKFDYGKQKNLGIYGTEFLPEFNFGNIRTPTYLYYSDDDFITTAKDIKDYIIGMYGPGLKGHVKLDHFTHIDFILGLRAPEEVYYPLIQKIYEDLNERYVLNSLPDIFKIVVKLTKTKE